MLQVLESHLLLEPDFVLDEEVFFKCDLI